MVCGTSWCVPTIALALRWLDDPLDGQNPRHQGLPTTDRMAAKQWVKGQSRFGARILWLGSTIMCHARHDDGQKSLVSTKMIAHEITQQRCVGRVNIIKLKDMDVIARA